MKNTQYQVTGIGPQGGLKSKTGVKWKEQFYRVSFVQHLTDYQY